MSSPRYEVYQSSASDWRWRLKAGNGEVVASGEAYRTKAGALRGVEAHRRSATRAQVKVLA